MRRKRPATDIHHRRSKHHNGDNSPDNLSRVPKTKHQSFHHLFFSGEPHNVARILNDTWIDPRYLLVVVERKELEQFSGLGLA